MAKYVTRNFLDNFSLNVLWLCANVSAIYITTRRVEYRVSDQEDKVQLIGLGL